MQIKIIAAALGAGLLLALFTNFALDAALVLAALSQAFDTDQALPRPAGAG